MSHTDPRQVATWVKTIRNYILGVCETPRAIFFWVLTSLKASQSMIIRNENQLLLAILELKRIKEDLYIAQMQSRKNYEIVVIKKIGIKLYLIKIKFALNYT